jgi:hypothetical protein
MYRALNEFLGRTTIDPTLRAQYRAGRIQEILLECGFDQRTAAQLALLRAPTFEAYLKRVYEVVLGAIHDQRLYRHPWPAAGLAVAEPVFERRGEAA